MCIRDRYINMYLYQYRTSESRIRCQERIAARRKDPLLCCLPASGSPETQENVVDKMMGWYARQIVQPWIRLLVVGGFGALLAFCLLSARNFEQQFAITDVLASDSYFNEFSRTTDEYRDALRKSTFGMSTNPNPKFDSKCATIWLTWGLPSFSKRNPRSFGWTLSIFSLPSIQHCAN